MDRKRILVIDNDPAILRLLKTSLKAKGYEVAIANNNEELLDAVQMNICDLIILDIMMPKVDGTEVCRRIREWSEVPVIVISARGDENEKVQCLELGADDYLTKPFGIAELNARIKTAFRHRGNKILAPEQSVFTCDGLEINFTQRRVTKNGKDIALTPTEYSILQHLAVNSDKVLTHSMILQHVWGDGYSSEKEYLRVFMERLRKKIEPNPKKPRYLINIRGVGYYFAIAARA